MKLDDALDVQMSTIIGQLTFFTQLKSLTIMEPRMMCCDILVLVNNTLPSLGRHLEYFKFMMPNKADIKLNDVKHIFAKLSDQRIFPRL